MKLFLFSIIFASVSAQAGVPFPGCLLTSTTSKCLKSIIDINSNSSIISGSTDPSSSATSANMGSIYLNTSNANVYRKTDNGSSINWSPLLSGTVAIGSGGTGQTTKAPAFNALSPMTTGGDLIYGGASGAGTRLANGSSGQFLKSSGGTSAPTWSTLPAGTLIASASPSAASSTTVSSLNGNTDKAWKIVIRGTINNAPDGTIISFRPNNDSTSGNYNGVYYWYYSGAPLAAPWTTSRMEIYRHGFGVGIPNVINAEIIMATATGVARTAFINVSHMEPAQPDGGFLFSGGGWNDTSSNITSLVFDWDGGNGATFTGTINIYLEPN